MTQGGSGGRGRYVRRLLLRPLPPHSSFALPASATPSQGAALQSNAVQKFCASRIRGDFDGDGRTDSAVAFSSRSICDAMDGRSWYLAVRLSRGGHLTRPLGHDLAAF